MIVTCPNCGTQYMVKDDAIPPGGRQVRCAACKHSWHQHPENVAGVAEAAPSPILEAVPPPQAEPEPGAKQVAGIAEATLIDPRSGPESEERAYEETVIETPEEAAEPAAPVESAYSRSRQPSRMPASEIGRVEAPPPDWREPPTEEVQDDEFSPFASADELQPKRRRAVLAILLVVLLVVALAAALWFFAPAAWKMRLGLAAGVSPLELSTTHMDRQKLESGNELLTVTGRVINPTGKEQEVPPLQAQLRTHSGEVVYKWTIAPPARSLQPGASASFNSTEVDVPPGGEELTITLGSRST